MKWFYKKTNITVMPNLQDEFIFNGKMNLKDCIEFVQITTTRSSPKLNFGTYMQHQHTHI